MDHLQTLEELPRKFYLSPRKEFLNPQYYSPILSSFLNRIAWGIECNAFAKPIITTQIILHPLFTSFVSSWSIKMIRLSQENLSPLPPLPAKSMLSLWKTNHFFLVLKDCSLKLICSNILQINEVRLIGLSLIYPLFWKSEPLTTRADFQSSGRVTLFF